MVDTPDSIDDLLAQFPDNSTGSITPQNMRNFIETLRPRHGSFYFTTPVETVISVAATPTKALGTTTAVNLTGGFTMPANNRLLYTGVVDVHAHIASSMTLTTAGSNKIVGSTIAKNGTALAHSLCHRKVGTGTDEGAIAIHADAMLTNGDYLEIFLENETDTTNLTIEHGYLFVMGMVT